MTKEDIIRMAREAGFADGIVEVVGILGFANFAALVAAHEREACALECINIANKSSHIILGVAIDCADAIRARGQA